MALRKAFSCRFGITHANAYHRILTGSIRGTHSPHRFYVDFSVATYADANARNDGKAVLEARSYSLRVDTDGEADQYNIIKQGYEHLKTLDDFDDAVDC